MPWFWAEPVSGWEGNPLWLHIDVAGLDVGIQSEKLTLSDAVGLAVSAAVPVPLHLGRGAWRVYLPLVRR